MRLTNYSWVLDGWQPEGVVLLGTGYCQCLHLGLPYIEFHAVTNAGAVSVRCNPCSLDQDRVAYAAMVRADLELALAKHERSQPPKFDAPTRLSRHLRESQPVMVVDGSNLVLCFDGQVAMSKTFELAHEVMGGETLEQAPGETPNPAAEMADPFERPVRTEMTSGDTCMQGE